MRTLPRLRGNEENTMYKLALPGLLILTLLVTACSESNLEAPAEGEVHLEAWIVEHFEEVADSSDFGDCTGCHGVDLYGSGDAVSCYSCHVFNVSSVFVVHDAGWSDIYTDHRAHAALNGFDLCLGCHGPGLQGSLAAPSCFAASVDGRGCHEDGPGQVPHLLDGSYLDGAWHGPDAKQDLTACQPCHGEAGGPGDNPRFNAGIFTAGGDGCESCHAFALAHPQNWAGVNSTFHYSAGRIQETCTLCHGVDLDGAGGVGPSCLGCHDSQTVFTLDCTYCHGYPPDGSLHDGIIAGVNHSGIPLGFGNHDECSNCHGMNESAAGGSFEPRTNYAVFTGATASTPDTIGDHWDGNIQMNADALYNESTFGCGTCHSSDTEDPMSDSGLPVVLKDFGL
jgi:hypothetical protein